MNNVFDEPDVVSVLGKCKKCGKVLFIDEDGLCTQCKFIV